MKFAITQIKVALAHLILDNELILDSPKSGIEIDPAGMMFQSKENLMIRFKKLGDCAL